MVYRNGKCYLSKLNYLKQYNPEYVLILSGDHIYKMNYEEMLEYHIEKSADVTISLLKFHGMKQVGLVL